MSRYDKVLRVQLGVVGLLVFMPHSWRLAHIVLGLVGVALAAWVLRRCIEEDYS
jgi:hypothetical protein